MATLLSRALLIGGGCLLLACDPPDQKGSPRPDAAREMVRAKEAPRAPELTLDFLERGLGALEKTTGKGAHVLELRATGEVLSLQVELSGRLEQLDYVESSSLDEPKGQVVGPHPIDVTGDGPLEANLFPLRDVDLAGIARSFRIARRAVDPLDGRVASVVVRRFLPFSEKVRARIYVDSPRMSGSIDTNERGVPLKRR